MPQAKRVHTTPRPTASLNSDDRGERDARRAAHLLDLVSPLCNVCDAITVLACLAEDKILRRSTPLANRLKDCLPTGHENYAIIVLTPEEEQALSYILFHIFTLGSELRGKYFGVFNREALS